MHRIFNPFSLLGSKVYIFCSRVRGLCGRGLPRPQIPLPLQVCALPGRTPRAKDHGESQETHVSYVL